MLWPTGVLQDEIQIAGDKRQEFLEIDRRGSSCPTLFAWNGERYEFVADMLGAGVVGHWIGPHQRDIPRPVEFIKIPTGLVRERDIVCKLIVILSEAKDLWNPEPVAQILRRKELRLRMTKARRRLTSSDERRSWLSASWSRWKKPSTSIRCG